MSALMYNIIKFYKLKNNVWFLTTVVSSNLKTFRINTLYCIN